MRPDSERLAQLERELHELRAAYYVMAQLVAMIARHLGLELYEERTKESEGVVN